MTRRHAFALIVFAAATLHAQSFGARPAEQFVTYIPDPVGVHAGQPSEFTIVFRIADGVHINSHTPADPTLIATDLAVQPTADIKLDAVAFPAGTPYTFAFAPNQKFSVYANQFALKVKITAAHTGSYTLNAALRYQACDTLQCAPPRTLPVSIFFTAN